MSKPLLQLHDAQARRAGKTILDIEVFSIAEGESIALLGPNGSGKSTFVNLITREAFPAFTVAIGAAMVCVAAFNAPVIPIMQKRIAPERFGRVMGLFGSLTTLAYPIGLFVAGPAADALDINCWFVVIGIALCILMLAFAFCCPFRALDAPAAASRAGKEA